MLRNVHATYRAAFSGLSREVWAISAVTLVYRCGTIVLPFMALYLTSDRGFTVPRAGLILAVYGAGALGGSFAGGWLGDAIGPLRVCTLSLILSGIALFVLRQMESFTNIAFAVFILSIVSEAFRPASAAAVASMSQASVSAGAPLLKAGMPTASGQAIMPPTGAHAVGWSAGTKRTQASGSAGYSTWSLGCV